MGITHHTAIRLLHYIRNKNTAVIPKVTKTTSIQIDILVHLEINLLWITLNATKLMDIRFYLKISYRTVDMKEVKLVVTTVVN